MALAVGRIAAARAAWQGGTVDEVEVRGWRMRATPIRLGYAPSSSQTAGFARGGSQPGVNSVCPNRVLRGGSWNNNPQNLRAANRNRNTPTNRNNNVGFRLASTLHPARARAGSALCAAGRGVPGSIHAGQAMLGAARHLVGVMGRVPASRVARLFFELVAHRRSFLQKTSPFGFVKHRCRRFLVDINHRVI